MKCELIGGPRDGLIVDVDFEYLRYGGVVHFTESLISPRMTIEEIASLPDQPWRDICYAPILDEPGHLKFVGYDQPL